MKKPQIKKGEIEYIAHCIEHGEFFITKFFASKNLSEQQLLNMGCNLAQEWGGECYKVEIA